MSALPEEGSGLPLPERPLRTERLELRLVEHRDLPDLLAVHSVDEVNRFLPFDTWAGMDDAEAWYEKVKLRHLAGEAIQFAIVEARSGKVMGSCLVFDYEEDNQRAELGYGLGQGWWGRGFAREAVQCLIAHAFDALGLRRLDARVDPRNLASNGLLQRLGFTLEGRLRQRSLFKGELVDVNLYGLLRAEWCPDRGGAQKTRISGR